MITNHTQLLNAIAKKINAQSYLEIGVNNGKNFDAIEVDTKVGVDPDENSPCGNHMTSDEFFSKYTGGKFDLIFIDGLHHAEQVKKDMGNAWNILSPLGCMVIHDVNPESEDRTHVPRDTKIWNGGVYKAAAALFNKKYTLDIDHGCMVIPRTHHVLLFHSNAPSWNQFSYSRGMYLNIVTEEELFSKL